MFVKQKQRKRSAYHYSSSHPSAHLSTHTHTWALASMRMSSSGGCPLFTSKLSPVPMRRRSMQRSVKEKAGNTKRRQATTWTNEGWGGGWLKVKSAHSVLCCPPFSVYVVAGLLLARALIGSTQVKQRPSKKVIVAEDFRVRETFPTNHAPAFL